MPSRDTRSLIILAVLAGSLLLFAQFAGLVRSGATQMFDEQILLALRTPEDLSDPVGPAWLEAAGRDITALGSVTVLTLVVSGTIGYLLLARRARTALFLLVSVGSGALVSFLLKAAYRRPRPELVPPQAYAYSASFPSGHAMMSAVVYLTLAVLLAQTTARRRVTGYFLTVAIVLTLLVGVSRVYLGVHWPTDVLAGWAIGAVWALLAGQVVRHLQDRDILRLGRPEAMPQEDRTDSSRSG